MLSAGCGNSPTSAISKAAGVAEGSLFTYFASKDELLNELYLEMRRDFDRDLTAYPQDADTETRLRYVWDTFLNLGIAQPATAYGAKANQSNRKVAQGK